MSDKPNPDSPQQEASKESASLASRLVLAHALDELIAGRSSAGTPGGPDGASPDMEGPAQSESSAGRCPQPAAWPLLVSGEAQPFEADELFTHAADCPDCANLLRSLTADPSAATKVRKIPAQLCYEAQHLAEGGAFNPAFYAQASPAAAR